MLIDWKFFLMAVIFKSKGMFENISKLCIPEMNIITIYSLDKKLPSFWIFYLCFSIIFKRSLCTILKKFVMCDERTNVVLETLELGSSKFLFIFILGIWNKTNIPVFRILGEPGSWPKWVPKTELLGGMSILLNLRFN